MRRLLLSSFALACAMPFAAHAEWAFRTVEPAGGGTAMHLAGTSAQFHGLGLRCDGAALTIQYLTNDPMSDEQMARANAAGLALSIGLDALALRLPGALQRVPQGVLFVAHAERSLLKELSAGKGEIAVAIAAENRLTHRNAFSLEGASGPLNELGARCAA